MLNLKNSVMKRFLLLLAVAAVSFVGCNTKGEEVKPKVIITPSVNAVEFEAEGGTKTITFVLKNAGDGSATVVEDAAWLEATIENQTLKLTAEANTSTEEREAKVKITYQAAFAVITVKQKGNENGEYDVVFKAKRFEGIYFGNEYSDVPNYYVILSDIGVANDGSPKANGTYYFFDMYNKVVADDACPILPNGEYKFDITNSYADKTFTVEGSWYAVMDAEGDYATSAGFKAAAITVEDGKFTASIEFNSGEKHLVTFEGELQTTIGHILSTFTEDVEFNVEGATFTAVCYGDVNENGQQNWFIEAVKDNDYFAVDVFTPSSTDFAGTYQALSLSGVVDYRNRFMPGLLGEGLVGTWYAKLTNNIIKGDVMAPMVEGALQIVVEGDAVTIHYGCKDDAGNAITGSVAGTLAE